MIIHFKAYARDAIKLDKNGFRIRDINGSVSEGFFAIKSGHTFEEYILRTKSLNNKHIINPELLNVLTELEEMRHSFIPDEEMLTYFDPQIPGKYDIVNKAVVSEFSGWVVYTEIRA